MKKRRQEITPLTPTKRVVADVVGDLLIIWFADYGTKTRVLATLPEGTLNVLSFKGPRVAALANPCFDIVEVVRSIYDLAGEPIPDMEQSVQALGRTVRNPAQTKRHKTQDSACPTPEDKGMFTVRLDALFKENPSIAAAPVPAADPAPGENEME